MSKSKIIKWEYRVVGVDRKYGLEAYQSKLNQWGEQGWELVQALTDRIIFKRPNGYLRTLAEENQET